MVLKLGSNGEAVKEIQKALGLNADGDFGNNTDKAVKEYQTKNGLTPDGVIGNITAAKLGVDLSKYETPVSTPIPVVEEHKPISGMLVTKAQLRQLTPIKDEKILDDIVIGLNDTLNKYSINTPLRICHFLAQILHESGGLTVLKENLNYSASGLLRVFPKYFTPELAAQYEHKSEKIANRVYKNRMKNGDEASGDGYKYRGRSALMITGRENYTLLSKATGIDFVNNPDLLLDPKYLSLPGGWYWDVNNINKLADKDDMKAVRKAVNGGQIGAEDCVNRYNLCKTIIK